MSYWNGRMEVVNVPVEPDYSELLIRIEQANKAASDAALRKDWRAGLRALQDVRKYAADAAVAFAHKVAK